MAGEWRLVAAMAGYGWQRLWVTTTRSVGGVWRLVVAATVVGGIGEWWWWQQLGGWSWWKRRWVETVAGGWWRWPLGWRQWWVVGCGWRQWWAYVVGSGGDSGGLLCC
ncbi:hypothetical protein HanXRQr2_Chr13g0590501 [Helianthus annuus]|uniref:Uncharacterized protein n=1 Tax=Helianthus annuus TaxID=4232 RepID=A0A9K3EH86_HELAN|nr:hypothetical protein HanXRQr2_Chr13g0590501 [Helianthus annuus]KAJ0849434.1 hypothetical protein HanPSC8_Chr13g0568701 [Helianthus annuus]